MRTLVFRVCRNRVQRRPGALRIARRDLFHSTRSLLRSPGFTLTALLLITIGIGANVAVFTLANFVLVRPLPFPQPDRLTKVWEKHPGYPRMELSPANYRDLNASSRSFSALAAYTSYSMSLVGQGEPQRIEAATVTANLFSLLERPVLIGRYFNNTLDGVGRLKPGVSLAQARSELLLIAARLRKQYPKENEAIDLSVFSLRDELSAESRLLLKALCGAALCVLVIVCANLANLLLARSLARERELSIRLSLGANRRNLLRHLLTESVLLGLAGGASATGVAIAALPLLSRLVPSGLPVQQVPSVDVEMLLFALALTVITVVALDRGSAVPHHYPARDFVSCSARGAGRPYCRYAG
jgi:FtsX-like permease family/MacB-like periplasmic core domain